MPSLKGALAAVLCFSLLSPPLPGMAADPGHSVPRKAYKSSQLQGDQRILHALNRFTFGPRPGDLEVVRAIGLDKWFDQQLDPSSLDMSDLDARLAQFPAMQWNLQDLFYRLPSNGLIRQAINGKAPVPESEILHAVYMNEIDRVSAKREAQAQKKEAGKAAETGETAETAAAGNGEAAENPMPLMKQP
ncbi:MAG: DUF1800 family protein, partial [Terracidiphilus sp.]